MSKAFETGHAKNLANFNTMISFCEGYGSTYDPAQEAIQLTKLKLLATDAQAAFDLAKKKQLSFNKAVDERMAVFAPLRALSQKMLAALAASGCSTETLDGAKTINRKIQGRRKNPVVAGEPADNPDPNGAAQTEKSISASQLSYDNLTANFSSFIELLIGQAEYKPNEHNLKTATLSTYLDQLKAANAAVSTAYTAWSNSRIGRNKLIYASGSGMIDIAQQVKNYVKSIFGNGSPEFKQVSPLEFKRISA